MLRRPAIHHDEDLGELRHHRGAWRGSIEVTPAARVPLVLGGGRSAAPDPEAVELARRAAVELARCRPAIDAALAEHAEPYGDGDPATAEVVHVRVERERAGRWVTEVGLRVPWDEEHTLGARLVEGQLFELNGSVPPL